MSQHDLKMLVLPVAGFVINLDQITYCEDAGNKVYVAGVTSAISLGDAEYAMLKSKLVGLTHWI